MTHTIQETFNERDRLVHGIFKAREKAGNMSLKVREKAGLAAVRSKADILKHKRY